MKYNINWNGSEGVFAVPDAVVDSLKLANGKSVKVLLYILKNKIRDVDLAAVADKTGVTDEDVEDALSFWQQVGVIYADGTKAPESPQVRTQPAPDTVSAHVPSISDARAKEKATKMLSPAEIAEIAQKSEEVAFLFTASEATLGKVLTYTEQRTLLWLHQYYGTTPDILMMIMDFAVSHNKATIGFIEKVATSWHEKGVRTHEEAEREIRQLTNYYSLSGQITAKLELNRSLTPTERKYVNSWAEKNITIDLIVYAYEKTIDTIGKVKFSYMNTILLDWYSKGYATPKDVKSEESKRTVTQKTETKEEAQHSYDLDLLFEHAMNTPLNTSKKKGAG